MQQKKAVVIVSVFLLVAGLYLASAVPADAQANRPLFTNRLKGAASGVWQGTLDFTNLGSTRQEPVTMSLSPVGVAMLISEHEPTEIESATVGIWEHAGGGALEVGIQAHRLGDGACAVIAAPDGSAGDDCILKIYGNLRLAGKGRLTGEMTLIFEEVDAATGEVVQVVTPALGAEFRKLAMDEFRP